jgi:hypothetical protein
MDRCAGPGEELTVLGVKGSQVQILSAGQVKTQVSGPVSRSWEGPLSHFWRSFLTDVSHVVPGMVPAEAPLQHLGRRDQVAQHVVQMPIALPGPRGRAEAPAI